MGISIFVREKQQRIIFFSQQIQSNIENDTVIKKVQVK